MSCNQIGTIFLFGICISGGPSVNPNQMPQDTRSTSYLRPPPPNPGLLGDPRFLSNVESGFQNSGAIDKAPRSVPVIR